MRKKATVLAFIVALGLGTAAMAQDQQAPEGAANEADQATTPGRQSQEMMSDRSSGMHGMMGGRCPTMSMMMGSGMPGGMGGMEGDMCPMCRMMMGSMNADSGIMEMIPESAKLTKQQQTALADLHAQQARQHFELMQQIRPLRQRLRESQSADSIDIQAVGEAYDELSSLRKKALLGRLTIEQQAQDLLNQN